MFTGNRPDAFPASMTVLVVRFRSGMGPHITAGGMTGKRPAAFPGPMSVLVALFSLGRGPEGKFVPCWDAPAEAFLEALADGMGDAERVAVALAVADAERLGLGAGVGDVERIGLDVVDMTALASAGSRVSADSPETRKPPVIRPTTAARRCAGDIRTAWLCCLCGLVRRDVTIPVPDRFPGLQRYAGRMLASPSAGSPASG